MERVRPVFDKAIATLEAQLLELDIDYLFTRLIDQVKAIDAKECLKLLVRSKLMFSCREKLLKIFEGI